MARLRQRLERHLREADVQIGGSRPWDIQLLDDRLPRRVAWDGLSGLADAYVDGWWECEALDQFYERCIGAGLGSRLWLNPTVLGRYTREKLFNLQKAPAAFRNGQAHYDLGNDLFEAMLDRRMVYSCGYWEQADNLDAAQEAKLDLICRKLDLKPGMRVLDIGCGWGSFVQYAAEHYGCQLVGITVSEAQVQLARERCAGLPVEIRLQDYRAVNERFDRVVSVGMFEHVGPKNYDSYMAAVRRCLKGDGLCLLHFFATQRAWPNLHDTEVIWVGRRIFPNFVVPAMPQVSEAIGDRFVIEDLHNFGADYDPTLLAWFHNFDKHWPTLREHYGDRFYRVWKQFLLISAAAFRCRKYQLWQIVLSPRGVPGGYRRLSSHPAMERNQAA